MTTMMPNTSTAPTPAEINAIRSMIEMYGLGQLWQGVYQLITQGYQDTDTILFILSTDSTPQGRAYQEAYFRRFPAIRQIREENQRRSSQGLPPVPELSPAQYVAQEVAYRTAVQGFDPSLATNDNITSWITGGVSPAEVQGRITIAEEFIINQVNPDVKDELRRVYGLSDQDMVRYVLSDSRSQAELEAEWKMNIRRANVGAAARTQGIEISDQTRDQIVAADQGFSFGSTSQQFSNVAAQADDYARLAGISGIQVDRFQDLISEEFGLAGGQATTNLKRRLASQERGRFSGSSGIGRGSLTSGGIGTQ